LQIGFGVSPSLASATVRGFQSAADGVTLHERPLGEVPRHRLLEHCELGQLVDDSVEAPAPERGAFEALAVRAPPEGREPRALPPGEDDRLSRPMAILRMRT